MSPKQDSISRSVSVPSRSRALGPNVWVVVRRSHIHGRGVYARAAIPAGTRVLEYTGERITKAEARRRELARQRRLAAGRESSIYVFELNRRHDLDGRVGRGPAKWVNHSCEPNCRAETIRGRIWIIARRQIEAGEELSFDYGFPYSEWRLHPCRCGAKGCVGFIVDREQRWRVRRILRAERKLARQAKKAALGAQRSLRRKVD